MGKDDPVADERLTTLTELLNRTDRESSEVGERLFDLVHAELHDQAHHLMRRQPPGHTLQTTALVNEAYLRLLRRSDLRWESRRHFFCVAARAMRCVLVDHARTRNRRKRRPDGERVPLDDVVVAYEDRAVDLTSLDEALGQLAERDELGGKIVELRFFGGLPVDHVARILGVSSRTARRRWELARAWLRRELR